MTDQFTVLVAADGRYSSDRLAKVWIDSLVSSLASRGWMVHVLAREIDGVDHYRDLWKHGALVTQPSYSEVEHLDDYGLTPRFRARTVVAEAEELNPDVVLVQGLTLSRFVAGSGRLDSRLWTIPLDRPYVGGPFGHGSLAELRTIAGASARILVADEAQRSMLDAEFPSASSKVRILPVFRDEVEQEQNSSFTHCSPTIDEVTDLHVHEGLLSEADVPLLQKLGRRLRMRAVIPRMHIHRVDDGPPNPKGSRSSEYSGPATESATLVRRALDELPGAVDTPQGASPGWELLPTGELARQYALLFAKAEGRAPLDLREEAKVTDAAKTSAPSRVVSLNPFDEASVPSVYANRQEKLRLVIAGSDFKFAGDLVEAFLADDLFDVRFDVFKHHAHAQPLASEPYLEWADVVLSEFAVQNAIWYSKNLAPHQSLIVHLHGFELLSDWITELDIDNVTTIVVASEFYRRKAHELRGWPLNKISVIPNSVNLFDFERPKDEDARFHLGLVGMVPILKRPDRALDLLESLLEVDPRYTLHIRGHAPWNYAWEWNKAAHQDAYRHFYARIGDRPQLLRSIAFEPFAPDMANWLRKIGWLLSPSSRETFHLAAIEGAMSGAVPLAWDREGARDIIGDEWTFKTTDEIRNFVVSANKSPNSYRQLADRAQKHVSRYRSDIVGSQWRSAVLAHHDDASSTAGAESPRGIAGTIYREVDALVRTGDFDEAKGVLDRHISITANDSSRLKTLELFVRGVLALDSRRINLIPPFTASGGRTSPDVHDFREPGGRTDAPARYIRVSALHAGTDTARILADPRLVVSAIGVAPFAYTGDRPEQQTDEAALRTISGAARSTSTFSGPVVTDALEDHFDSRIAIDGPVRFDRWVEAVSSEIRDHIASSPHEALLIDAPWHTALPAAIAARRTGVPFIWAPPETDFRTAVAALRDNPYTSDLSAQFNGTVASRAQAVLIPKPDTPLNLATSPLYDVPNLVVARSTRLTTPGENTVPTILFDSATSSEVKDLAMSTNSSRPLGALNATTSVVPPDPQPIRVAVVASQEHFHRMSRIAPDVEAIPLVDLAELSPTIDVLVVDESVTTDPARVPGEGTLSQRVRKLFDAARTFGITGIFNADTHVGGDTSVSTMAEKADAVTGTRAVLAIGLLSRTPNSITRVSSASVIGDNSAEVLAALAAVGVGEPPCEVRGKSNLDREVETTVDRRGTSPATETSDLSLLTLPSTDGVSIIVATRLGADRLPTMLASVSNQSMHDTRMELIIVQNGPPDGSEAVVRTFATQHPQINVLFLQSDIEGASAARNMGLEACGRDYVTFLDDDDEIESNYILNMWLSADAGAIVAAPMRDVDVHGVSHTDIPNNRRLAGLAGRRTQLTRASGLLGLNACKLIPAHVARELQYPIHMGSGEDVAFMSQLLLYDLELVPADTAPNSAYVRHRRPNSVSRRELTYAFAIDERLAVVSHLENVRVQCNSAAEWCIRELQLDQLSYVARYIAENPTEGEDVAERVLQAGLPTSLLKNRYKVLHSLALRSEKASV